jgi:diguanylate cyclase (GGDEF)-like protein
LKLRTKSNFLIIGSLAATSLALSVVAVLALRAFSLETAREQGRMASEIVRVALTEEMKTGMIEHRAGLLARLREIPGLREVHIARGPAVDAQFGPGSASEQKISEAERRVMETGHIIEELSEGQEEVLLNYNIPYIAHARETPNCLQCHEVEEGTVLGAISMTMELTAQRSDALKSIGLIVGLLVLLGTIIAFTLKRLLNPIVATTSQMNVVVSQAEQGDFSGRLVKRSDDEVGEIAEQTNRLMATLENSIGSISKEIESLTKQAVDIPEKNLLKHTVEVVHNMVGAARFKQAVENDRNLEEVYKHLRNVLLNQFELSRFSLYEISNSRNRLQLVFAEGLPKDSSLWCETEITIDAEACRAKRTGLAVSSVDEADICALFCGNRVQNKQQLMHVCLPVLMSGSIGSVLQIIFTPEEATRVLARLSTIQTYLDEVSPIVETKRLMATLRESAMRDAMTGLYNRRFLEEYLETLVSDVARRKTLVGVLMCDVDFFKQVNDTLGHEIGDSVLKGVAVILKQSVRASDLVIRYGGEEFLALLIDADEKKALEIAERVRAAMEANTFQTTSGPLSKTLSVGISMYPLDNEDFWGCVKFADVALYQAKETGRNKVLRFTRDMWKEEGQV